MSFFKNVRDKILAKTDEKAQNIALAILDDLKVEYSSIGNKFIVVLDGEEYNISDLEGSDIANNLKIEKIGNKYQIFVDNNDIDKLIRSIQLFGNKFATPIKDPIGMVVNKHKGD